MTGRGKFGSAAYLRAVECPLFKNEAISVMPHNVELPMESGENPTESMCVRCGPFKVIHHLYHKPNHSENRIDLNLFTVGVHYFYASFDAPISSVDRSG